MTSGSAGELRDFSEFSENVDLSDVGGKRSTFSLIFSSFLPFMVGQVGPIQRGAVKKKSLA